MKHILLVLLVLAMTSCKNDKKPSEKSEQTMETKPKTNPQKTTYYFIRHAEKDLSDPSESNPKLTDVGLDRATFWAEFFKDKNLDAIYSTNYTRTIQTLIPTLDKTGLELQFYAPNKLYSEEFLEKTYGKTVLIAGHQLSIPALINKILGKNKYQKIPVDVYGNLYILTIAKDGSKTSSVKKVEMENNV